jgi:tetratricopeptide (TPR) repeat protein
VDSLSRAGRHGEALAILEKLLERSRDDYQVEVMAAQEELLYSFLAPDREAAKGLLRRAIPHAQRAMALEPNGEEGRYLNMAATGRLALIESSPQERARLGAVVDSAARSLLEANPLHAGAHNALGKLYSEVADLSWFSRIFARRWLGGDLVSRATWAAAEEHLRRAAELQPGRNFHLLDLGALLAKRGRREEARKVLEAALEVPLETPGQEEFRDQARRILEEIGRQDGTTLAREGLLPHATECPSRPGPFRCATRSHG